MIPIYVVLIAMTVLISVPYILPADASIEMKHVPFWWSIDPETGEAVYTDYFKEVGTVHLEHESYLASIAVEPRVIGLSPSVMLEVQRSNMIEVTTSEYQNVKVKDSLLDHGPYANPDYTNRELVTISTWIPKPVPEVVEEIVEVIPEEVTLEITPVAVPDVIEDITPEVEVVEVVEDLPPVRVSNFKGNTHWDVEEATMSGHDYMTPQQIKDHKKHVAEWKAYEYLSTTYPSQYPAYVHDYDSDGTHD